MKYYIFDKDKQSETLIKRIGPDHPGPSYYSVSFSAEPICGWFKDHDSNDGDLFNLFRAGEPISLEEVVKYRLKHG